MSISKIAPVASATGFLPTIAIQFEHEGRLWNAQLVRFPDGRPAKIFLLDSGIAYHSATRLVTLLMQHGVDLIEIRRAVIGGPLSILLDRVIALYPRQEKQNGRIDVG